MTDWHHGTNERWRGWILSPNSPTPGRGSTLSLPRGAWGLLLLSCHLLTLSLLILCISLFSCTDPWLSRNGFFLQHVVWSCCRELCPSVTAYCRQTHLLLYVPSWNDTCHSFASARISVRQNLRGGSVFLFHIILHSWCGLCKTSWHFGRKATTCSMAGEGGQDESLCINHWFCVILLDNP